MSAVFGIINKRGADISTETVNAISKAMTHRGKQGVFTWVEKNVAFGCCRNIIFNNNIGEELPYSDSDLVFTGNVQLSNRLDLLRQLSLSGELLPDAYVVTKAYKKWGKHCVNYLEGEYVCAIWDKHSNELFAFIDHLAHKSFYYYDSPDQFIFCTEIKGIEAIQTVPRNLNEQVLIMRLMRQHIPGETYNKSIKRLKSAESITVNKTSTHFHQYWLFQRLYKYGFSKDEDWYGCLSDIVEKYIDHKTDTDGSIGVKLSGGLDSSIITSILSNRLKRKNLPLYAFSSVATKENNAKTEDERVYIEMLAKYCGNVMVHYEDADDVTSLNELQKIIKQTEDYADAVTFMIVRIMEAAAKANVSVMFTGWGGDQWVSSRGNAIVYNLLKRGMFKESFGLVKEISARRQEPFLKTLSNETLPRIWLFMGYLKLKGEYLPQRFDFVKDQIKRIYKRPYIESSIFSQHHFINAGVHTQTLRWLDAIGGFNNMEMALPFYNKNMLEFLADVPPQLFLKGGYRRSFVRNSFAEMLPKEILWRDDKHPYVPDLFQRLEKDAVAIKSIIKEAETSNVFKKYIAGDVLQKNMQCFSNGTEKAKGSELMDLYLLALGVKSLDHFKKFLGYSFQY